MPDAGGGGPDPVPDAAGPGDPAGDRPTLQDWFEPLAEEDLFQVASISERGRALGHALLVLLGFFLVPLVLVVTGTDLLALAGITESGNPVAFYSTRTAVNLVGVLLVGLGYLYWQRDPGLVGIRRPTLGDAAAMLVGFLALAGLMLGGGILFEMFGVEPAENVAVERGSENPELFLVFLPIQFLLTGPAEELLFRGVLQGVLRRAYGVVPAIALASTLFALVHVPALIGGDVVPVLALVFASGVLFGVLYEYTGTLLVPIVAHACWNTLTFATEYAEATGALLA